MYCNEQHSFIGNTCIQSHYLGLTYLCIIFSPFKWRQSNTNRQTLASWNAAFYNIIKTSLVHVHKKFRKIISCSKPLPIKKRRNPGKKNLTLWTPSVPNGSGLLVLLSTNKTSASRMRSSPVGKALGINSLKCWTFEHFWNKT